MQGLVIEITPEWAYDPRMHQEDRFIPRGAIAFFVAMVSLYAAIWFFLIGIMIRRG